MTRKEVLLEKINLEKGYGLEIGPLCWPLVTKEEAEIYYVDHATTQELRKIYADEEGVDLHAIVNVDYALKGKTLRQTVGDKVRFDYIVASHVIEHIPDMVGWFKDLSSVLKPGGIVALAIPDKRYTFDIDRRVSELSDVVGAFLDTYECPSSAAIFDHISNYRQGIDAVGVWQGNLYTNPEALHRYTLKQALEMSLESKHTYVDAHCFVFTPQSFLAVVRGLIELDLLDFTVASFHETAEGQYEFIVSLQKASQTTSRSKKLQSIPKMAVVPHDREQSAKIAALQADVQRLDAELDALRRSKSWQLTRPLRAVLRSTKPRRE